MDLLELYLVRHGQTEYNRLGKVQGSGVDADLNETGWMQARAFFQAYRDVPFKKVFASSLKRAQQSVHGFTAAGIATVYRPELNEIGWGDLEGQIPTSERKKVFKSLISRWDAGDTGAKMEGGESPDEVATRQEPFLRDLTLEESGPILICMHGRAMRILLCQLMGWPLFQMNHYPHQNLGLYRLMWAGFPDGPSRLTQQNCLQHLTKSGVTIT